MNVVRRVFASYNRVLAKHTMVVQSIQTSMLLATGDIISQSLFEQDKPWDYKRTMRFSVIGLALGPGLMVWYKVLEKVVGTKTTFSGAMQKMALDQFVFSPIMLVIFIGTFNVLEGKTIQDFEDTLKANYTDILVANWKVWPGIQMLNFSLVPLQYRVLLVQSVAVGWNTYVAWKLHK